MQGYSNSIVPRPPKIIHKFTSVIKAIDVTRINERQLQHMYLYVCLNRLVVQTFGLLGLMMMMMMTTTVVLVQGIHKRMVRFQK
jgi:hypothetical protein